MPLTKEELIARVLTAISDAGWTCDTPDFRVLPLAMRAVRDQDQENMIVYIWNVTHGGRTRGESEYRIQITPSMTLQITPPLKTLLLGYYEIGSGGVFVGFDPAKHQSPGSSASIQVQVETLRQAQTDGLAIQEKAREGEVVTEVAIAFRPELFMDYVTLVYPGYQRTEITGTELDAITRTSSELSTTAVEALVPQERQRTFRTYNQLQREASFAGRVIDAYENRCAICGVQLRLLDAAHIIPVGFSGSTDETKNGIALCPTHHRSFDRGLIGITPEYLIHLNEGKLEEMQRLGLMGGFEEFKTWSRVGSTIHLPVLAALRPDPEYLRRGLRTRGIPEI